jgi:hypothetical protein
LGRVDGSRGACKIPLLAALITVMVSAAREAGIAQLAEQLICNQQVVGSIPTAGSVGSLCREAGSRHTLAALL